jgi:hypothetical protein
LPVPHGFPQPPQLALSVWGSMHAPPQSEYPLLQVKPHALPLHVGVALATAGQACPQEEQFLASLDVSMHAVPQTVVGDGHVRTHEYPPLPSGAHTLPPLHWVPHPPQLLPLMATQPPMHMIDPAAQPASTGPSLPLSVATASSAASSPASVPPESCATTSATRTSSPASGPGEYDESFAVASSDPPDEPGPASRPGDSNPEMELVLSPVAHDARATVRARSPAGPNRIAKILLLVRPERDVAPPRASQV